MFVFGFGNGMLCLFLIGDDYVYLFECVYDVYCVVLVGVCECVIFKF